MGAIVSKTIVVYGLARKGTGPHERDYSDIDLVYHVTDDVTPEDVSFLLHTYHDVKVAPVRTDGTKLQGVIGVDDTKLPTGKPFGRIALGKQIRKDLAKLKWQHPRNEKR